MKLGIICAMAEELDEILLTVPLQMKDELHQANSCYTRYAYHKHEVITVVSGIGKVNAAITTQIMINRYAVDAVINVGVAGSLSPKLGFGDVVIATDLVQHDVDISAFGVSLGQIPRLDTFSFVADIELNKLLLRENFQAPFKIVNGRIISGDQFIADAEKAQFLHSQFAALACEMEGAAIAHVCYLNGIPFTVVRSLSDMAGQSGFGIHSFYELKYMAAKRAALVVNNLLERL
jgi:adenosylhomocysteine nucleosidase